MKQKNMMLMVVAIGCGLVAAFLTARLSGGSKEDTVEVMVAKKELPVGTILDEKELENMIGTMKLPKSSVTPDTITNIEELRGKRLNRTLKEKNPFTQGDVALDSGIKLPEGMSKYSVKTDIVKLASGFAQAGDKVDVILTESQPNGKAKSGIILRDMLVLSVDRMARRPDGSEAVTQVNSVSLAVTPPQSLILSNAERRGDVKFLLRDPKNPDKNDIAVNENIPGFDKDTKANEPVAVPVKTISVVYAAKEVEVNTFITKDNFNDLFVVRNVPEEGVFGKPIMDPATLYEKYITNKMEADMPVRENWLSTTKKEIEAPKTVIVEAPMKVGPMARIEADPEMLFVQPREQEKPLYPRKFEQIINNQRHYFVETAPGEFRKVEGNGADLKDLPNVGTPEKKEEKKPETGDRAA